MGVQRRAIQAALAGKDVLIHAETGSGKTLAFVLPTIQRLKPDVPFQALIVVPSNELAVQTAQVTKKLWDLDTDPVGLVVAGTGSPKQQFEQLRRKQPPIIIGSAKQLQQLLEPQPHRGTLLANLRILVLDEVDALLPPRPRELIDDAIKKQKQKAWEAADKIGRNKLKKKSFLERDIDLDMMKGKDRRLVEMKPTQKLLTYLNLRKPRMQLICATATAGSQLLGFLNMKSQKYNSFEKMKVISSEPVAPRTKGLRSRGVAGVSVPARIRHEVILNPDKDDHQKLLNIVDVYYHDAPHSVLMTVGNTESVNGWVSKLRGRGITNAASLYETMGFGPDSDRATVDAVEQLSKHQELQQRFEQKDGDPLFIVATQMTCRGIDLKGVDVVYITALAKNTDEYQHLAGRSGREGRVGKAISFLDQDEVYGMMQFKRELGVKLKMGPAELIPIDALGPRTI
jgi:superfamily II DNA/RNA helicase